MSSQKAALQEAIKQILSCALQADSDIQRLAEERKKALEMIDDYPFILIDIIEDNEEAQAEKHMASVFLKNYLQDFFTSKNEIDKHFEFLSKLSLNLVQLLTHTLRDVRKMICKSLAILVYKGFWPCINSKIMSMMQSENEDLVFAAVSFLKQLLDPYECNNVPITAEYFEVLLNIYQRGYPSQIRLKTISSMSFIITYSMDDQPSLQRDAVARISQVYGHTLKESYSIMNDFQLKSEVIKGILMGLSLEPELGSEIIVPNLPAIGQLMTHCCHEYKKIIMNSTPIPRDACEEENDANNFNDLINNILNLVNCLITTPDYADLLMNGLDNLLYCLFVFICCYDNMELTLFMDDDDTSVMFSTRSNAVETLTRILISLSNDKVKLFFQSLHNVFQKHINECSLELTNSEFYYIRIMESLMYGLGILRFYFPKNTIFHKNHIFPHSYYLESWSSMIRTESNFLILGRLYWLASRYSATLNPNTLSMHLKQLISHLQSNFKLLYIPCAEALKNHLEAFAYSRVDNRNVITNSANELAITLFRLHQKLPNKPKLFLNGMGHLFKYHENIARGFVHNVQSILIDTIILHFSDISVLQEVSFLLSSLAVHVSCKDALQDSILQFILKLIYNNPPDRLRDRKDVPEKGFEFLNTVVIYSPEPINNYLLVETFHAACNFIMENEENDISLNEAAVKYISTTMIKLLPQIKNLRNDKGMALTDYIPKILFELLDPAKSLLTSKVGRFCVISIMILNEQLEPNIELILKSVLSSFQGNKVNNSHEKMKALMLIFAYIFMCRPENTTNFLSSIPGPNGGSALSYLFNKWRLDFVTKTEKFEKTINTMAITQIIRYAIDGDSEKINNVNVTLTDRNVKTLTGIEFLYFLLINILLSESDQEAFKNHNQENDVQFSSHDQREDEEEFLFKFHPCSNINITNHIKTFLKNYTPFYFNVLRNVFHYDDVEKLQKFEVIPDLPME